MECFLFPPSGPAVGYLCVVYPGNTRFQRNHQNFGVGRQKAAARNRWRGSTGIRLCPMPVAAPLGRKFPHQHWQHPWLWSSGMLMPKHTSITTLGSPSQDFHPWITARGYSRPRERFFWAVAPAQLQQEIHIRQKGKVGSRDGFGSKGLLGAGGPQHRGDSAPQAVLASPSPGGLGGSEMGQRVETGVKQESRSILGED